MNPGFTLTLTDAKGEFLVGHISSIVVEEHPIDGHLFYILQGLSHEQAQWLAMWEWKIRPRLCLQYALAGSERDNAFVADILEVVHSDLIFTEEYPSQREVKVRILPIYSYRDGVWVDYRGPL